MANRSMVVANRSTVLANRSNVVANRSTAVDLSVSGNMTVHRIIQEFDGDSEGEYPNDDPFQELPSIAAAGPMVGGHSLRQAATGRRGAEGFNADLASAAKAVPEHRAAALAVVLARAEHRAHLEAGESVGAGQVETIVKLRGGAQAMLEKTQFASKAGQRAPKDPQIAEEAASLRAGGIGKRLRAHLRRKAMESLYAGLRRARPAAGRWGPGRRSSRRGSMRGSIRAGRRRSSELYASEDGDDDELGPLAMRNKMPRDLKYEVIKEKKQMWSPELVAYPEGGLPADRLNQRFKLQRLDFGSGLGPLSRSTVQAGDRHVNPEDLIRVCPTCSVNPNLPKEIDHHFTSVQGDGVNIKFPSPLWAPPVQMWEPFVVASILSLPYFQAFIGLEEEKDVRVEDTAPERLNWHERHIEKLLRHTKASLRQTFAAPMLREHLRHPCIGAEETRFLEFMAAYLRKKFEPFVFRSHMLYEYTRSGLFETAASPDGRTNRVFILSPSVIELLCDEPGLFEGQYREMVDAIYAAGLPVLHIVEWVNAKRARLAERVWSAALERSVPDPDFHKVHMYLDLNLIQRRYGGYSLSHDPPQLSRVDQMLARKVGATLKDLIAGSAPSMGDAEEEMLGRDLDEEGSEEAYDENASEYSMGEEEWGSQIDKQMGSDGQEHLEGEKHKESKRRLAEWEALRARCVDPEDVRFQPLGLSLTEAFLLIQGMVLAMDRRPDADGDGATDVQEGHQRLLRTNVSLKCRDRHVLAAALIIDLYMREKVDVWAWQLANTAQPPRDKRSRKERLKSAFGKSDVLDLWTGPISNVYRVFAPEDAPLWTTEVPPFPMASGPGRPHWMEVYVPLAEEIFQFMEVPGRLGEVPVWQNIMERNMLVEADEEVDRYALLQNRFTQKLERAAPGCFRIFFTPIRRYLCCLRRRPLGDRGEGPRSSRTRRFDADLRSATTGLEGGEEEEEEEDGGEGEGEEGATRRRCWPWSRRRRGRTKKLPRLQIYEFQPPELPSEWGENPVAPWFEDLDRRRLMASKATRPPREGLAGVTYNVGDHVRLYRESQKRYIRAKVAKVDGSRLTLAFRDEGGAHAECTLPVGHRHLRAAPVRRRRPVRKAQRQQEEGSASGGDVAGDVASSQADKESEASEGDEWSEKDGDSQPAGSKRRNSEGRARIARGWSASDKGSFEGSMSSDGDGWSKSSNSTLPSGNAPFSARRADSKQTASKESMQDVNMGNKDGTKVEHSNSGSRSSSGEGTGSGAGGAEEDGHSGADALSSSASGTALSDGGSSSADRGSKASELDDRVEWWDRLKAVYCDAYLLLSEEGKIYSGDAEQEVALWRAQLLMFFFALQTLFEVAWEGHNGLERVLQAVAPPFAKLPLQPPPGMEAAGSIIRGLAERARLAGDERPDAGARNVAVEAGMFQEKVRKAFEDELYSHDDIMSLFDEDLDGAIQLPEFIRGMTQLPEKSNMRTPGMPKEALDIIIRDLATELFFQLDADRSGELTHAELARAFEERKKAAEVQREAKTTMKVANAKLVGLARHIPGTTAHSQWQEAERKRLERARVAYDKFLAQRHMRALVPIRATHVFDEDEAEDPV